jgi:hypothetical protein
MSLRTLALLAVLSAPAVAQASPRECAQSPGKVIEVCVSVEGGQALYEVQRKAVTVLAPSALGLSFKGEPAARYTDITAARRSASDTSWEQPWGEQRLIRDNHSELTVTLAGDTALNKSVDVVFRIFDDGVGFRYSYAVRSPPARLWQSPPTAPSSRPSATIRPGGIRAGAGTRRVSLHPDRRAPHHTGRDAADAEGRATVSISPSTKPRWSISPRCCSRAAAPARSPPG